MIAKRDEIVRVQFPLRVCREVLDVMHLQMCLASAGCADLVCLQVCLSYLWPFRAAGQPLAYLFTNEAQNIFTPLARALRMNSVANASETSAACAGVFTADDQ